MSIAITEDHRALADTAADFLAKRDARGAARDLLEAADEGLPPFWGDLVELGWLGCTCPRSSAARGTASRSWWSWSRSSAARWRPGPSCRR